MPALIPGPEVTEPVVGRLVEVVAYPKETR